MIITFIDFVAILFGNRSKLTGIVQRVRHFWGDRGHQTWELDQFCIGAFSVWGELIFARVFSDLWDKHEKAFADRIWRLYPQK